ncbi:MAG: methyltransferase domain-containing protein [Desulfarculus sp.]|nr:methyltransferase domain-containing protein [Desulfarculus sp.]
MTTAEKLDRSLFENSDPCDPEFWRRAWRRAREASFLKCSQVASPQAWHDFYAQVSDSYWELWGQDGEQGQRLVAEMNCQGLLKPGCQVLDVGCGPGTMALPLAQAGAMVTALDWCRPMLDNLERLAGQRGLSGITTRCQSWDDFPGDPKHDLVLAAFFPDALSVQGLERLEGFSRGRVGLVLGTGREHFAFRRQMWQQILEVPYHDGGFHLACALGWLNASGRMPNLRHLAWDSVFDHPLETVFSFYRDYFAIFGKRGPVVERQIRAALEPWRVGERVRAQGGTSLALVWWDAPDGSDLA